MLRVTYYVVRVMYLESCHATRITQHVNRL